MNLYIILNRKNQFWSAHACDADCDRTSFFLISKWNTLWGCKEKSTATNKWINDSTVTQPSLITSPRLYPAYTLDILCCFINDRGSPSRERWRHEHMITSTGNKKYRRVYIMMRLHDNGNACWVISFGGVYWIETSDVSDKDETHSLEPTTSGAQKIIKPEIKTKKHCSLNPSPTWTTTWTNSL